MRLWGSELFYGHLLSGLAAAVPSYLASPTGGRGVSPLISQGAGFKKIGRDETILVRLRFCLAGLSFRSYADILYRQPSRRTAQSA